MASRLYERFTTRGPREGQCNICGEFGRLTEDHAPPRACRGIQLGEMHALHDVLAGGAMPQGRHVRRGPSFRTLCARCNNGILGGDCDPALARFSAEVRALADSRIALPPELDVEIQPQLVMRSVIGHLCAMGVGRYRKGGLTESIREYMTDKALPLPDAIRVYYWLYPFREQVLIRDAVITSIRNGQQPVLFWLMKFFPLAFLVTFEEQGARQFNEHNLDRFRADAHDSRHAVPVRIRPIVHELWPQAPADDYILLYGQQAMAALPRERIMRA